MARRKKSPEAAKPEPLQIIARLLAMIAVKGVDKDDAAVQLSGAGLEDKEIADLLGVSVNYVSVAR